MTFKWIIPIAGLTALGSTALPAQSAPTGLGATASSENAVVQQTNYYRHRYYRYYRDPSPYFYYGHRHHRHWRRW